MPNDLYYFYESDLNKGSWTGFVNSLPHHLQEMFKNSMGEGVVGKGPANVLQGYRGPHNNGTSGDSGYLGASNGLQEVRYWWGASKHMNWVPISGWITYGICSAIGDTNWHSLYFDSKTGECLSHNKNQATEKLNNKGWQLFQEGKYSEAAEYFNNAYQACSSGYQNEQTFKNNIDKAKAELDAINLNSQGDNLFDQGRYHESHNKYQEAYNKSQITKEKNKYAVNQEKAQTIINKLLKLETLWDNAWKAENDTEDDRSEEAGGFFQEVLRESKDGLKIVPNDSKFKQYEILVSLKMEGNALFNEGLESQQDGLELLQEAHKLKQQQKYDLANVKFYEAKEKFSNAKEKFEIGSNEDQRFVSCVEFVQKQLNEVMASLEITEQHTLASGLSNLDINISNISYLKTDSLETNIVGDHNNYHAQM
ncbi:hypothetical protein JRD95_00804 [Rickettsia parkeri]|nr:hypothetical protein JRD95_00804 [Rickettsia parkeri]